MAWAPSTPALSSTPLQPPPPEEELLLLPPPQAQPVAAAPVQEATPVQQTASPSQPEPANEPAPPPAEGPITQAANALGGFVQETIATPVAEYIPDPVKEAVGPALSGTGGALGQVGSDLAAVGDAVTRGSPGDVLGAVLQVANRPYASVVERQGDLAAKGEPLVPSPGDILADPSRIIDVIPGAANTSALGAAIQGEQSLDDWATANPREAAVGGAEAYERWLASGGIERTPAGVDNPTDDELYGGSPGDVLGQVAGEVGKFAGSVKDSARSGAITPFLRGMAIDLLNDPLLPAQVGLSLLTGSGSLAAPALSRAGHPALAAAVRSGTKLGQTINQSADIIQLDPTSTLAGIGPTRAPYNPRRVTDLTTEGLEQRQTQSVVDAVTGILQARDAAPAIPTPVVPAPPVTSGVSVTPPLLNGRLAPPPNLGQQVGAAPPLAPSPYAPLPPATPTLPASRYGPVSPGMTARTRPVPGAPRKRPVSPVTGRPLIAPGSRPEIEAPMRTHLDHLGLTEVGVRLVNDLRDASPRAIPGDQALYRPREHLIYVALDATKLDELPRVLDHEAIHAIHDLGLFRGREFDTLVKAAEDMGLTGDIARRYADVPPARLREEMVAELYTRFRAGETIPAPARTLLQRIGDFLLGLGRASRETLPADVMRRIESGEVGRRSRQQLTDASERYMRVYHGSSRHDLEVLAANPPERTHGTGAATLGVFTTPHSKNAAGFAWKGATSDHVMPGRVYAADVDLKNPAIIDHDEFKRVYDVPGDAAHQAAQTYKAELIANGHDGIHVMRDGIPVEIVSFNDVPVTAEDAFRRAGSPEADVPPFTGIGLLTAEARSAVHTASAGYNGMDAGPDLNRASHLPMRVHFTDNSRIVDRPLGEIIDQTDDELTQLIQMAADPTLRTDPKAAKYYEGLQKKFSSPEYPVDFAALDGPDNAVSKTYQKQLILGRTIDEAVKRAAPKVAKSSTPSVMSAAIEWSRIRSQLGLFNYANVMRYATQNIAGNTIVTALAKPSALPTMLRKVSSFQEGYRSIRGIAFDEWDDMQRDAGMGVVGTVRQMDKAQLGTLSQGRLPKPRSKLEAAARKLMHPATTAAAQIGDNAHRVAIAMKSTEEGFHALNTALPHIISDHVGRANPPLPYLSRDITRVVKDFLDGHRVRINSNTGKPRTTMLGRIAKHEPIWQTNDLKTHLATELKAINPNVDPRAFNVAIDGIVADVAASKRVIHTYVGSEVDRIAFGFLPTNISEAARLVMLYPYWITKASALYAKTAITHPVMISTYGRMMDDLETQLETMEGVGWMQNFFRVMNSPAGMSVWYSLPDMITTLFTFADWQKEEGAELGNPTELGKLRGKMPLGLSALVDVPLYISGLYGDIGTNVPDPIGLNRLATLSSQLLNLANAHGMLPIGIGKDAMGNPVPITTKPLQELTANVGHEVSTLLKGITGQEPIPVPALMGTQQRDLQLIIEQDVRTANPALTQEEVDERVTAILHDPDSPEYGEAYRKQSDLAFQISGAFDTPAPDWIDAVLQGVARIGSFVARIGSPVGIQATSEQLMLDSRMKGMAPSGTVVPRTEMPPDDPLTENFNENKSTSKSAATMTLEARVFHEEVQGYYDADGGGNAADLWRTMNDIAFAGDFSEEYGTTVLEEPVTVGGVTYTHDDLVAMEKWQRREVANAYISENGYDYDTLDADNDTAKAANDQYKLDHPQVAQYLDFNKQKYLPPAEAEAAMQQQMASNPAYAEHIAGNPPYDSETGEFVGSWAFGEEAYLASQGIRPSVFSRTDSVPTAAPAGYVPPVLETDVPASAAPQTVIPTNVLNVRAEPGGSAPILTQVDPGTTLYLVEMQPDWAKVRVGAVEGWVTTGYLQNGPSAAPAPEQNGIMGALGGIVEAGKDALGAVVGPMTGWGGSPAALITPASGYGDTMGTIDNPADHYAELPLSGGDWSVLDQFNDAYPTASEQVYQETGVAPPPDLMKALNAMESGYGRINPPTGVRNDVRGKPLAGFVGVFKDAADSWGADFERMTTDPEYAIYGMGLGLGRIANWDATQYGAESGTVLDNYGWDGVMAIYYSGQPHLDAPQPADDTTTVRQYVENINAMRSQIQ